jgi:hypothetical protein
VAGIAVRRSSRPAPMALAPFVADASGLLCPVPGVRLPRAVERFARCARRRRRSSLLRNRFDTTSSGAPRVTVTAGAPRLVMQVRMVSAAATASR